MHYQNVHRHPLGFLTANEIPTKDDLQEYYAEKYFQSDQGNYRQRYTNSELLFFEIKIHQKFSKAKELGYFNTPGQFLDVGCGEGFALA